jgi:cytoskeletal protein CcmA (bactofilin family)
VQFDVDSVSNKICVLGRDILKCTLLAQAYQRVSNLPKVGNPRSTAHPSFLGRALSVCLKSLYEKTNIIERNLRVGVAFEYCYFAALLKSKNMKTIFTAIFALLLSIESYAIEIKSGDNVTIAQPVREDLYVTGGTVIINAPIYGDLIVAGGTITLNDSVQFDLIAAGGEIFVNGYVGDDIRIAGGRLHLSGNVSGDVVVAGGTISIDKSVTISGSMLVGGGEVTLDGMVMGQLKSGAGRLVLNGKVQKEVDCRGGQLEINGQVTGQSILAATDISVGANAEFHNDVRYWNKNGNLDFKSSIKKGVATFDPSLKMKTGQWHYLGFASVLAVLWYLSAALLMIFIMQYLFSEIFKKAAATVLNESMKSLGIGVLFIIAVPVAIVISFVTIVGVPVGLILLFGYLFLFMLATSITSLVIANWLNNIYYAGKWKNGKLSMVSFLVFTVLKLFSLTPFVGFLITGLMICMAWGAILINVKWKKQRELSA